MILSTIRRLLKEDISRSGSIPSWVDALLSPLNQFIDQVVLALRNNLSFADNFACKISSQTVVYASTPNEVLINPQSNRRVSFVMCGDTAGKIVTKFGWRRRDDGNVGIKILWTNFDSTTPASTDSNIFTFIIFLV